MQSFSWPAGAVQKTKKKESNSVVAKKKKTLLGCMIPVNTFPISLWILLFQASLKTKAHSLLNKAFVQISVQQNKNVANLAIAFSEHLCHQVAIAVVTKRLLFP